MKNGVTVTFGGKSAQSVTVPSKTEITAVTPAGTAGESVAVVVTNKKKVEKPATLSQKFTYTDATPPTVTSVDPSDGTLISEYEDSLNVGNTISFTFSEDVDSMSGMVSVTVESTPESISKESGDVAGSVSGTGNMVTFTSMSRCGRAANIWSPCPISKMQRATPKQPVTVPASQSRIRKRFANIELKKVKHSR